MQEVYDFLKKCQTFYIATAEGDQPRVRPFGALAVFEGKIYIQTGKVKDVSKQMGANPKVEICAFDGEKWIRVQAVVVNDDRIEAKRHMIEANPILRGMYKADDDITQVLYLKDAVATISSMTEKPRVINF